MNIADQNADLLVCVNRLFCNVLNEKISRKNNVWIIYEIFSEVF
jgi:hypothetical protein